MTDATTHRAGKRPGAGHVLPLDVLLEIVGRTDAVTVVRCAAACKELCRGIADPAFHACLRLLLRSPRFVRSLLRGHLVEDWNEGLHMVDSTKKHATELFRGTDRCKPITARDGLVLIHMNGIDLCVCSPATGRSQVLPPGPRFNGIYVLLVGDAGVGGGAVGRPFKVLKVNSSFVSSRRSILQIQTFSSEHGAWGPLTDVPTPLTHGRTGLRRQSKHLVVGDTVHWLCYSDNSYYVFKLHVREGEAARVTVTKLPPSFHRACPVMLVAKNHRIFSWAQSKLTAKWKDKPQLVIADEALLHSSMVGGSVQPSPGRVQLEWFGERSGVVLLRTGRGYFWLDLGCKELFGWSKGSWSVGSNSGVSCNVGCPYEIDLSSWVPTFCKPSSHSFCEICTLISKIEMESETF